MPLEDIPQIEKIFQDPHVVEVLMKAQEYLTAGANVYFKWTCASCQKRAICDVPNTVYPYLRHEDCGYTTPTEDGDLGFLLAMETGQRIRVDNIEEVK